MKGIILAGGSGTRKYNDRILKWLQYMVQRNSLKYKEQKKTKGEFHAKRRNG